ncbi:MAG: PAS domain S-box protein [Chromatiales bacterium]|nr:PAS domain S-box protein [Chromatiales bacterium]
MPVDAIHTHAPSAGSTARNRDLLDYLGEGVICIDKLGVITYANGAAAGMLGERPDTVRGRLLHTVIYSMLPDGSSVSEEVCPVYAALQPDREILNQDEVFWRADGTVFPVEYSAVPMDVGGHNDGAVVTFRDVSERKEVELLLRESEEKTRLIIENALDAILSIDADGLIAGWNSQATRIFGYTPEQALGKPVHELIFPLRHRNGYHRGLAKLLADGDAGVIERRLRVRASGASGREFPVEISMTPFRSRGALNFSAFIRDITEQRSAELNLRRAKEEAEAASLAKSEFLANMSHEIRTPLTAIIGFGESLLDESTSDADKRDAVRSVIQNGKHLLAIINDILDLSKIEADRLEVEFIAVNTLDLLDAVGGLMERQAAAKDLELRIVPIWPLPQTLQSDPTRLRQILLNLLSNAIKFTEKGTIWLLASCEPSANCVQFSVVDQGIGIAADKLDSLFDAFTQADTSTTRKYGGTGLGLTISSRLAKRLGGELQVESLLGSGSLFICNVDAGHLESVPMLTEKPVAPKTAGSDGPSKSKRIKGRILVAEDNPSNQKLVSMYLKRLGANFVVVENGVLAVEEALANDYDLILMDMQMPEMSGIEATELLRMSGNVTPILGLTANAMKVDLERFRDAGAEEVLLKPIDLPIFNATLARYLPEGSSKEQENAQLHDDPLYRQLQQDFLRWLPGAIGGMEEAMATSNWGTLRDLAHQTKGSAGNFGFSALAQAAADLEDTVRAGRYKDLTGPLTLLKTRQQQVSIR